MSFEGVEKLGKLFFCAKHDGGQERTEKIFFVGGICRMVCFWVIFAVEVEKGNMRKLYIANLKNYYIAYWNIVIR